MTSPSKIIYISASEYPSRSANSIQVVKQSNAFSHQGYSVTILGRANYKDNFNNDAGKLERAYGISQGVNLALLKYRLISGGFRSALYPLWVAFSAFNKRPDIVYGRHALGLLSAGLITRPKALIFECHGPPGTLESIALRLLVMLKKLDRIVVISKALKNILVDRYPYLQQVETIVAHDGCETPTPSQEASSELSIGYVGSFYRGRGLDLIAKLATKLPSVHFHLIGGDENEFINITGMSLSKNVICHGRVPPAELHRYYELFNVALAPYGKSIEVADGTNTVEYMSPLKIFEYMGHGKAIIASDLAALREVLTDRVNALLAKPSDPDDWYNAILVMQDITIRKTLTTNSLRDALEKHTWEARAQSVLLGIDNEE